MLLRQLEYRAVLAREQHFAGPRAACYFSRSWRCPRHAASFSAELNVPLGHRPPNYLPGEDKIRAFE